jgi:asparagine synthase (glutamine-hydrolysing)
VLLFASEIKALLASGLVPARPDPRGINHVFTFFALPGAVTCFAGVNCLLPGRYLKVRFEPSGSGAAGQGSARVEEHIYWQIDFPDRGEEERHSFRRSGGNASSPLIDEYEAVMKRAVERRLRADVPVVSYLSGGVDSSLVVALACARRRLDPNRHDLGARALARRAEPGRGGGAASRCDASGRRFRPAGDAEHVP